MENSNPPVQQAGENTSGQAVVTAIFTDPRSADAAVRELREVGVPAASISIISRNEDKNPGDDDAGAAGTAHENVGEEGLTYRASSELPNYEDLPSTVAEQIGDPMPVVLSYEVPPDEPLGGSERLGLSRDNDLVRRNEAQTNADEDIYSDFPDQPGGFNPNSPVAAAADVQEQAKNPTDAAGSAAAGVGLGSLAGLLVGMAGLAIPGIGPFIAAGPLAGALSGMLAGGAAGGIIGGLSAIGVPDEYAREYASRIEQGHTLVSVRSDELSQDLIERVLVANHGENVQRSTP